MPKVRREVLARVKEALDRCEAEVEATNLQPLSKQTYVLHAHHFVRWLDDDFEPGHTLRHQRNSTKRNSHT